jgi:hypothetical protein
VTRASRLPRALAAHQLGKVIKTATTTITTLVVIGMAVIVVDHLEKGPSISIAKIVHVEVAQRKRVILV